MNEIKYFSDWIEALAYAHDLACQLLLSGYHPEVRTEVCNEQGEAKAVAYSSGNSYAVEKL